MNNDTENKSNTKKIDLDPKNYSIDDIIQIFGLDYAAEITPQNINTAYKLLCNKFPTINNYTILLKKLRYKLIEHITVDKLSFITDTSDDSSSVSSSDDTSSQIIKTPENTIQRDTSNIISYNKPDRANVLLSPDVDNPIGSSSYIIQKRDIEARDIFNTKFPKDILNPIRTTTTNHLISIDTLFIEPQYKSNDFIIDLIEGYNNVVELKISSVELPPFPPVFNSNNNRFQINLFNMNDGTDNYYDNSFNIIIPSGNYSIQEFKNILNNIFKNVSSSNTTDLNFLFVDINTYTDTIIIRAKNENDTDNTVLPYNNSNTYYSPNFKFDIIFNTKQKDEPIQKNTNITGIIMGFKNSSYNIDISNTYIDNTVYPSIEYKGFLQAENIFQTKSDKYVYLDIDDYNKNNNNIISSPHDQILNTNNIIARIPLENNYDTKFIKRTYFGPVNIEKFRIRLLNKFGELLNTNDNYSFMLEITQLYS